METQRPLGADFPQIAEFIVKFNDLIDHRASLKAAAFPDDSYESTNTSQLAAALSQAQATFPVIDISRENPWFKSGYSDLDVILRTISPVLGVHGLSVTQQERLTDDGSVVLHTRLRHETGEWVESRARIIPLKNDEQTYGSTLNYRRRYSLMSLLGVTVRNDPDDDDGEVAMIESREKLVKGPSITYNPKNNTAETVSRQQLEELEYELAGHPDLAEEVLTKLHLRSLADMPKDQYRASIIRIREIRDKRNTGGAYDHKKKATAD